MQWTTRDEENMEINLGQIDLLPMLSNYSYLDIMLPIEIKKQYSVVTNNIIDQTKQAQPNQKYYTVKIPSQTIKNYEQSNQQSESLTCQKYYSKNACKNIVKKCLRSIQQSTYSYELRTICSQKNKPYQSFYNQIMIHLQKVSGPSALKRLLKNSEVGEIFREYLKWQALRAGHMKDLKVYVEYKNKELIKLLKQK